MMAGMGQQNEACLYFQVGRPGHQVWLAVTIDINTIPKTAFYQIDAPLRTVPLALSREGSGHVSRQSSGGLSRYNLGAKPPKSSPASIDLRSTSLATATTSAGRNEHLRDTSPTYRVTKLKPPPGCSQGETMTQWDGSGQEQGVNIESPLLALILAERAARMQPTDKVFRITSDTFRQQWRKAAVALGMPWFPPPHSLRHSGPSEDATTGRR